MADDRFNHPEVNSLHAVKILLCYLLNKLKKPVLVDDLLTIIMESEIINYFYYNDAIEELKTAKAISIQVGEDGLEYFHLEANGKNSADYLKDDVSGFFRERLMEVALTYFSNKCRSEEVSLDYYDAPNGCYLNAVIKDSNFNLMELKIYAPDREQAKFIGKRIYSNPAEFYRKVIEFTITNKEEKIGL